jgi:hypothetical protein
VRTADVAKVTVLGSQLLLAQGTSVVVDGVPYVTVTGGAATVSLSGSSIVASGPAGAAYKVRDPAGVTSVVVNGTPVAWSQVGGYALF